MRFPNTKPPFCLLALLWMLALARPGAALEKKDLVGQWQGYFTEDPKAKEETRVKLGFDFWLVKDEIEGVVSLDIILLETLHVAQTGPNLVIEVESMFVRGTNSVYKCEYSVNPEGVSVLKGICLGRNGQTIAWLDLKKVPEKGRVALADKALQGTYKGSAALANAKAGEGFELTLTLNLEGEDVGGKVALQSAVAAGAKPVKAEYKLEEIRRGLDRLYLKWTDAKGVSCRIMATATPGAINGSCVAGSFGGGWLKVTK